MIRIEKTDVYGWESALRGMRNPMNSWDKSDTVFESKCSCDMVGCGHECFIGENDLDLMKRLSNAGAITQNFCG